MSVEKPTTAYALSIVGGIFVIIGGLAMTLLGAVATFFVFGIGGLFGILGILWGVLMIIFASRLDSDPSSHATSGAMILIFSLLSWVGGLGGLLIGFLLGLVGGILAIVWSPQARPTAMPLTPVASATGAKYCINCGTQVVSSAVFCPKCGARQP